MIYVCKNVPPTLFNTNNEHTHSTSRTPANIARQNTIQSACPKL